MIAVVLAVYLRLQFPISQRSKIQTLVPPVDVAYDLNDLPSLL